MGVEYGYTVEKNTDTLRFWVSLGFHVAKLNCENGLLHKQVCYDILIKSMKNKDVSRDL